MEQSHAPLFGLIALVAAAALLIWQSMRRRRITLLRDRFGQDCDRTQQHHGARKSAEAALEARSRSVAQSRSHSLSAAERQDYGEQWLRIKSLFVDSPVEALRQADTVVSQIMAARGFAIADFGRREDISGDHAFAVGHYHAAQEFLSRHDSGESDGDRSRQAMQHYETLFAHLVGDPAAPGVAPGAVPPR